MERGTDAYLVVRARAGDPAAWGELVDRYVGLVHAVCRCYRLGDRDADRVNEVVWLRLVEQLRRLARPEAVGAWIAATSRAECLRVLRAAGRVVVPTDDVGVEAAVPAGAPGPVPAGTAVPADGREPDRDPAHVPGPGDRALVAAVAGLGVGCQRLLRLLALVPSPPPAQVGAALDMATAWVDPACDRCLAQLRAALADPAAGEGEGGRS